MSNSIFSGANYLMHGFKLLSHPKLRHFLWLPIIINCIIFFALSAYFFQQFSDLLNWLMDWLPNWLDFLAWVIGILAAIMIVLIYGYCFSILTNLIAAPFYGLLAERVEKLATGKGPGSESLWQMIIRTFGRELTKLWYFLTRSFAILLLYLLPPVGQVISIPWGAWCMSVQYADYAADNHKTPFIELRSQLRGQAFSSFGFGGLVMLGLMVPLLNIIVMPAAVVGGTLLWLEGKGLDTQGI